MRRFVAPVSVLALVATLVLVGDRAWASSDTSVRWTSFSESSTCAAPYTGTPIMSRTGSLAASEPVLGPFGTYFGRTLASVRSELTSWVVPYSGGITVGVNRAALPAFRRVAANLARHAVEGRIYRVQAASAHTGRTIGGSRQLSRHALGTAIDINPAQNPFRDDPGQLVTNMPGWYVDAWESAGFCWGGSWRFSKDPMHFSWLGPAAGGGEGLAVRPPLGSEASYAIAASFPTLFGDLVTDAPVLLADAAGFGPVDVVMPRPSSGGLVIDVSGARAGFGPCSHFRWFVPIPITSDDLILLGDISGDSRSDVVALTPEGSRTTVRTSTRTDDFAKVQSTAVEAGFISAAIADQDGDRRGDLWLFDADGGLTIWQGPHFNVLLSRAELPGRWEGHAVADRDGDTLPEVFAVSFTEAATALTIYESFEDRWVEQSSHQLGIGSPVAFGAADEDGDGRADAVFVDRAGELVVAIGNSPTGRPVDGWWNDPGFECRGDQIPLHWAGTFFDDDGSVFERDIEWIAHAGITRGCNPPFNDAFCPGVSVSRGEMAAFLVRALALPEVQSTDRFRDDDESVFEADIEALAAAGITRGCSPTTFCPDAAVQRSEMAAFLVRALQLPSADQDRFGDDDGSIFESDIQALAASGITLGCNPPANSLFCPDAPVTRAQMAAFLQRALG